MIDGEAKKKRNLEESKLLKLYSDKFFDIFIPLVTFIYSSYLYFFLFLIIRYRLNPQKNI